MPGLRRIQVVDRIKMADNIEEAGNVENRTALVSIRYTCANVIVKISSRLTL